jgi:hypothetical protein
VGAKAYRMVHAERIDSAEELHRLLEQLRTDKERLDAASHPAVAEIEAAREMVRYRIEELDDDARADDSGSDQEGAGTDIEAAAEAEAEAASFGWHDLQERAHVHGAAKLGAVNRPRR